MVKDGIGNGIGKCLVHDDIGFVRIFHGIFPPQKGPKGEEGTWSDQYGGTTEE